MWSVCVCMCGGPAGCSGGLTPHPGTVCVCGGGVTFDLVCVCVSCQCVARVCVCVCVCVDTRVWGMEVCH